MSFPTSASAGKKTQTVRSWALPCHLVLREDFEAFSEQMGGVIPPACCRPALGSFLPWRCSNCFSWFFSNAEEHPLVLLALPKWPNKTDFSSVYSKSHSFSPTLKLRTIDEGCAMWSGLETEPSCSPSLCFPSLIKKTWRTSRLGKTSLPKTLKLDNLPTASFIF